MVSCAICFLIFNETILKEDITIQAMHFAEMFAFLIMIFSMR